MTIQTCINQLFNVSSEASIVLQSNLTAIPGNFSKKSHKDNYSLFINEFVIFSFIRYYIRSISQFYNFFNLRQTIISMEPWKQSFYFTISNLFHFYVNNSEIIQGFAFASTEINRSFTISFDLLDIYDSSTSAFQFVSNSSNFHVGLNYINFHK